MKKLMLLFAIAGLVAGCAHDQHAGWAGDENEMDSGSGNSPTTSNMLNPWAYAPPGNTNNGR
jgi:hypothetical protein